MHQIMQPEDYLSWYGATKMGMVQALRAAPRGRRSEILAAAKRIRFHAYQRSGPPWTGLNELTREERRWWWVQTSAGSVIAVIQALESIQERR